MSKRVGVIGGGISGLTTAYLLKRKGYYVTVFEGSNEAGGNVQTLTRDGYTVEQGPNSLLRSPRIIELVKLLKLESQVLAADESAKKRYIFSDGRLEALGPKSFINGYFSLSTILGLMREPFVRSRSPKNESVADFVTRRISAEFLDKAIDPFVSGVYAGDPKGLSMRAAFPKLYEMERDFGSLIMGSLRRKSEKSDSKFPRIFSFHGGLRTLIRALAGEIADGLLLQSPVSRIDVDGGKFHVNGGEYDAVVVSTPSFAAGALVDNFDPELARLLSEVVYAPVAVVVSGFQAEKIGVDLDGFGFLIPSKENRPTLGTLYHSAVFPERSPDGAQLLMTFLGGVRSGDRLDTLSDDDLKAIVLGELGDILDVRGEPDFVHIKRWEKAIPQYGIGYEDVIQACSAFEKANPGIYFCSNFYRGISMGDCVKNAFETADSIEEYLNKR